jgi:hypothetical protein
MKLLTDIKKYFENGAETALTAGYVGYVYYEFTGDIFYRQTREIHSKYLRQPIETVSLILCI